MERTDITEAVSFLIGTGTLHELVRAGVEAAKPNHDFRAHTCDECAWVTKGVLPYCRRVSWNCIPTRNDVQYSGHGLLDPKEPACPAYVPREAQP